MQTILKVLACISIAGLFLYFHIDKQNDLTELRLAIPTLEKEVQRLKDENTHLQYEIDQIENPIHLMELIRQPEFGYLKYPDLNQILTIPQENSNSTTP